MRGVNQNGLACWSTPGGGTHEGMNGNISPVSVSIAPWGPVTITPDVTGVSKIVDIP